MSGWLISGHRGMAVTDALLSATVAVSARLD